jgi:hypothetical protein
MQKIYFSGLLFLVLSINCFGQTKQVSDSLLLDSTATEKALEASIDSLLVANASSSYFQIGFGVGNQLYSSHNLALNAKQVSPPLVLTPTVGYFNKSGFSIVATDYLLNENKSFGANQYSITPGFETQPNTPFDFLISYTRYFINNPYSNYSSPIQNDLYSSLVYKKSWLQGGFALGYSTGISKAVVHLDTTINAKERFLYDSITNNLKVFTMIFSVQHNFGWKSVFNKEDSISFIPQIMLNFGSYAGTVNNDDNLDAILNTLVSKAKINALRTSLTKKIKKLTKLQHTAFGPESAGIELQGSYTIGNFSIEPDIYLDYFLPQTTSNSFTQVYVVNFNYSF